ncbi:enoyl-CoA hydratase/isomerase family protein [Antrihabitans cavernicola]|uniref:Probable enoyl-CoA hydratase EchA17 n=1 Tax=Antrihabitans cavernicola TaxID=2495913 RepID=A0A5A7SDE5_9NOCA|nr:enoyl-CoA hydratase-related protein [Spelaeibacter cavernicola]KAA0024178.1 enoyl-CoA hydratase/isomerase family protein [Spelaeibacter cavernicola]
MAEFVSLEVAEDIGTIRITRPPVNALNLQSHAELRTAARAASENADVAAVIVYGGEKVFAAGDDIKELAELDPAQVASMAADLQAALGCIATIPKPTVAAISNYALGGGLEVALGADRRIVGDNVKLGLPEILLGVIPGGGGTQRLARLIGPSNAKDLIFTGRFVDADEALLIGLVDQVVAPDEVYNAARTWAEQFVGGPARALAAAKVSIDVGLAGDLVTGLELEQRQFAALFETADAAIGLRSFLDNGPGKAKFTGE